LTAELRDALANHKQQLISLLRHTNGSTVDPIVPAQCGGDVPLSYAQERLWLLEQIEEARGVYHIPACAWIDGPLNKAALQASIAAIIKRHDVLRATFHLVDGKPVQRIGDATATLQEEDLRADSDSSAAALRRAGQFVREPFRLDEAPLLRCLLLRTAENRHLLALSIHHILADAWSIRILLQELAALYRGHVDGVPAELTLPAIQYKDFSIWQRTQLTEDRLSEGLAFWSERLANVPRVLDLPTDRPRRNQTFRGAIEGHTLPAALVSRLRQLARSQNATLFHVLLAAFQILLHRYTSQESFAIGTPTANRSRPELESLIGFFVNTVVLRGDLSGDPDFLTLLERVRHETIEGYAREDIPFEAVVAHIAPPRSLSHNPIFQVMFALEDSHAGLVDVGPITLKRVSVDPGVSKFDLYVSLIDQGDGTIKAEWEYATDLFLPTTIHRMMAQFETLLSAIADSPDARVSELRLLPPAEQHLLIEEWNRTSAPWPGDKSIVDLFDEQVEKTPHAIAVIDRQERINYSELQRRADRLASALVRLGLAPEALVGVSISRSSAMVVAVLGVLKAGAAYVALDPAYPPERISFMVKDAAVGVIVTDPETAPSISAAGVHLFVLDREMLEDTAPAVLPSAIDPAQLAYVIYTSGSTGVPKGILIEHRNTVSLLAWARTVFSPAELRGVLASTSLCFDLSIFEIFLPLITGGCVIVAQNALELPWHPAAADVTLINSVPSAVAELVRTCGVPKSVRVVNLAGEPLKPSLVDQLYALGHIDKVYDLYGPGETTTYSTFALRKAGGHETIGRPIANTRVYVLDRRGQPAPTGVPGEIYIAGPGVTRGYHNREQLTASRYLPDPFHAGRMYRSGDLGSWDKDGELRYLGRLDNQVKIRGFRIELGEIEHALLRQPGVQSTIVHVREDLTGAKRLVAYYTGAASAMELRCRLEEKLPSFMVPSAFVQMDALPMTPNGKINRAALPDPGTEPTGSSALLPPRTKEEQILCRIVADVLHREAVGVLDNFFEIGGDSILSMQVVSRANEKGLRLTPRDVFAHQTVEELAVLASSVSAPAAMEQVEEGSVPLAPIQRWALTDQTPSPHHFNQWVLLTVPSHLNAETLRTAVLAVAAHHGALKLRFTRGPEGWSQFYSEGAGSVEFQISDDLERDGERAQASLDLSNGPVGRVLHHDSRLLLIIHHLVVDGVSWRILIEDLVTACTQLAAGHPVNLLPATASYGAWVKQLESAPASSRADAESFGVCSSSRIVSGAIEESETRALVDGIRDAYRARIDEALLAALSAALSEWNGAPQQIIDIESHGRDAGDLDVSRTVGWFTSLRPIEITVPANAEAAALLSAVKLARRRNEPGRDTSSAEISFNYLGSMDQALPVSDGWSLLSYGWSAAPERPRPHLLAFTAATSGGRLTWEIEHSLDRHASETIEHLSKSVKRHLHQIARHCERKEAGSYSPVDFPRVHLTQEALDTLVARSRGLFHRNIEAIESPSEAQEGILFQSFLAEGTGAYITQVALDLKGQLDEDAFEAAWKNALSRHAALRACYVRTQDQSTVEVILRHADLPFERAGWAGDLNTFLEHDRARGIDVSTAPLMRVTLIRRSTERCYAVWTFHHVLLDGWSVAIILREVAASYAAALQGRTLALPASSKRGLPATASDASRDFWKDEMQGWRETIDLPFAHSPVSTAADRREHRLPLDASTTADLHAGARRHRVTLHSILEGAWALLLARCSGSNDVLFGGVVSGRSASVFDLDSAVGLFMRTVPVRVRIANETPVIDWLKDLQSRQILRAGHAALPLPQIAELSELPRGTALFESLLVFENYPIDSSISSYLTNVTVEDVIVSERPHYPLTLVVSGKDQLSLTAVYDASRFTSGAIERLLHHYRHVVTSLAGSQGTLAGLSPLEASSAHQILVEWNSTARPYPLDRTVVDYIEEQAAAMPDATAIEFEEESISYAELDRRSNRVANMLRECGAGPESLVAVHMHRSLELPIALLGILKCGAAYVPVDPELPESRREFILKDAQAVCVLNQQQVRDAQHPTARAPRTLHRDSAAYMIYTSGSTGKPKGAVNTHAGLLNRLLWMQETFRLQAGEGVLQKTPFTFDVSVWEFFWPLMFGARLVMARPGGHLDRDYLVDAIERYRITTLHFVPSMLQIFVEAQGLHRCASLRRVIASGEALTPALAAAFHRRLSAELHNLYGPTEAAIDVSWYQCVRGDTVSNVPIGRPVANTQLYVLGADYQPVPVGIAGELMIGGVQVGRGYWNRPDLTAERFVPNPFGPGRLYRTGDRARFLADGNIEYLGRADHQLKIRGVRIEAGEIESALRSHPQVSDAVIVIREDGYDRSLVACCTPRNPAVLPTASDLRQHVQALLPAAMVPSSFVVLDAMPLLSNGKIDRKALLAAASSPNHEMDTRNAFSEAERTIAAVWKDVLGVDAGPDQNFFEAGGHSLKMMRVHGKLQEQYGAKLKLVTLFEHPTIASLARFLSASELPVSPPSPAPRAESGPYDIAVIGMACRFPGASTPSEYWNNLLEGRESITFFSDDVLRNNGVDESLLRDPAYIRAYGALRDAEYFDASFFDIPPNEADILDPQQRVFLEVAWEAFEQAGYDPARCQSPVGVFAGAGMNTYALRHLHGRRDLARERGSYALLLGSDKDFLSTRISYKLNLTGPSFAIQTACSTSLVAIATACESLLRGDCRMALAGGVSIRFPQQEGYLHEDGMIFSADGHCRPFDIHSSGTVGGSGAGAVLLKRLHDAIADGDHIHAVIKGAAINNDGSVKVGYTAPSLEGQARVITTALDRSGIDPGTIEYIETHGTATKMGDPIEVAALTRAFQTRTQREAFCGIGSVKSNFGHLDAAAGVAGFIKAVLAVEHGVVPASLHFEQPNPQLELSSSPFFVNSQQREWKTAGHPRRAGVSSFGIGGTNAHAIIEQAPVAASAQAAQSCHLITLSARSAKALDSAVGRLCDALEDDTSISLADAAFTLIEGRHAFAHRLSAVCRDRDDAVRLLRSGDRSSAVRAVAETNRPVVFLFSGIGTLYNGVASSLYHSEAAFRRALDHCAAILRPHLPADLLTLLWSDDPETLRPMAVHQPALLAVQYALVEMWKNWGITPVAMVGSSAGDYAAACAAGVFKIEESLPLMVVRGRLTDEMPAGAMLAVFAPEAQLMPMLGDLSIAIVSTPASCVVSGATESVERFRRRLIQADIEHRPLDVDVAFHSSLMDGAIENLRSAVDSVTRKRPTIPFANNFTGTWMLPEEAADAAHWAKHLRAQVRFSDGVALALKAWPNACFLEIGPGRSLASAVRRHSERGSNQPVFTTLRHPSETVNDDAFFLETAGAMWTAGVPVYLSRTYAGQKRRRVPLPTYPFERRRFLIEPEHGSVAKEAVPDWLYAPTWQRAIPAPKKQLPNCWMVLGTDEAPGSAIAALLRSRGAEVIEVQAGAAFQQHTAYRYTIDASSRDGYDQLFSALGGFTPDVIVHAWSAFDGDAAPQLERGFYSLLWLAQTLVDRSQSCRVVAVTRNAWRVTGAESIQPAAATVAGPVRLMPQEAAHLRALQIDVTGFDAVTVARIVEEAASDSTDMMVAYRNGLRWLRCFAPVAETSTAPAVLRDRGTYIITGGTTGVGLELAEEIATLVHAPNLILVSRTHHPQRDQAARERLSAHGANAIVMHGDVANPAAMESVFREAASVNGAIHGVVHAAGISGGGIIRFRTRESIENEFAAKIVGTTVLHELASRFGVDLLMLCSSLSAITGGFGSVAYTAGCAFQDAFAEAGAAAGGIPVVSVNWSRWRNVGMAVDVERLHQRLTGKPLPGGLHRDQAREAFRRILSRPDLERVVVIPEDPHTAEQEARAFQDVTRAELEEPLIEASAGAACNDTESAIIAIWRDVLGVSDIGSDDTFASLGGDSLLMLRMVAAARRRFGVPLQLNDVYASPTVTALARHVEAVRWAQNEPLAAAASAGSDLEVGVL